MRTTVVNLSLIVLCLITVLGANLYDANSNPERIETGTIVVELGMHEGKPYRPWSVTLILDCAHGPEVCADFYNLEDHRVLTRIDAPEVDLYPFNNREEEIIDQFCRDSYSTNSKLCDGRERGAAPPPDCRYGRVGDTPVLVTVRLDYRGKYERQYRSNGCFEDELDTSMNGFLDYFPNWTNDAGVVESSSETLDSPIDMMELFGNFPPGDGLRPPAHIEYGPRDALVGQ